MDYSESPGGDLPTPDSATTVYSQQQQGGQGHGQEQEQEQPGGWLWDGEGPSAPSQLGQPLSMLPAPESPTLDSPPFQPVIDTTPNQTNTGTERRRTHRRRRRPRDGAAGEGQGAGALPSQQPTQLAFPEAAMVSLTSLRSIRGGGTRANLYGNPSGPMPAYDPATPPQQQLLSLTQMPSLRQLNLYQLMNSVGYVPDYEALYGPQAGGTGGQYGYGNPDLAGPSYSGYPEMQQVGYDGEQSGFIGQEGQGTGYTPIYPSEAVMAAEASTKKKKKHKHQHKDGRKHKSHGAPAGVPVIIEPGDVPQYPPGMLSEFAGPLQPTYEVEQPLKPIALLPIPPPPNPPYVPKWLHWMFPDTEKLPPFLTTRHPNLATNILTRSAILLLVAIWVIIGYIPFFPPSSTQSTLIAEAVNHTAAIQAGGPEIYFVSTEPGYTHFRRIASLNTNAGTPGTLLPPWREFNVSGNPNASRPESPKEACVNFMATMNWKLPGYTATGVPDPSISNDTSNVQIKFNGPSAPGWGLPRGNGSPALKSVINYIATQIDKAVAAGRRDAKVVKQLDQMYTRDSNPLLAWDEKVGQDVIDGETGDYVNPRTGIRTIVASGVGWISVRVSGTGEGKGKKGVLIVAGMDTPPTDPPLNELVGGPALLLAFLSQLLSTSQTPSLPYDVVLLFVTGTAAPTQETTLSAPSSFWYADSGATGLLLQPGFRHFVANSEDWFSLSIQSIVWLGGIGSGPLEFEYGVELATTIPLLGSVKTWRLQGVPFTGVGSSIGKWIRTRSNATWTTPFQGPLWDARFKDLNPFLLASMTDDTLATKRIRFIHAFSHGAADRTDWGERATTGALGQMAGFLAEVVSDPAKLEAKADYNTDYSDWSYYPLGNSIVSWSLSSSWAFAVIDFLLASAAFGWGLYRRYATHEGATWLKEIGGWAWAMCLWTLGLCVVGTGVPVAVYWVTTFSSATIRLYLPLGLPPFIPSPSLPLLAAGLTLAWNAVASGESTIAALHTSAMWLLSLLNIIATAMLPQTNWFLSFTVLFGVLIGLLEFWCEEYARYLVKMEDVQHYEEMTKKWHDFEHEMQEREQHRQTREVPDWTNLSVGGPGVSQGLLASGAIRASGAIHASTTLQQPSGAIRATSGAIQPSGSIRATSGAIPSYSTVTGPGVSQALTVNEERERRRSTSRRRNSINRARSGAVTEGTTAEDPDGVDYRHLTLVVPTEHHHHSHISGTIERGQSQSWETANAHHSRRAAEQTWNLATYADVDTPAGAAALADIVDDMLRDRTDFDGDDLEAEEEEEEDAMHLAERRNATVYQLFYTSHLYHLPTTFFLILRTTILPFLAFAPVWAAVTAVETSMDSMSSWANTVTGVPWVAVIPAAATTIACAAIIPLWAMWSENRVTARGVEKDWSWARWIPPAALFVAFLGTFLAGLFHASKFTDGGSYPIPTTVGYFLDTTLPFGSEGGTLFFSTDETAYTPFSLQLLGYPLASDSFHRIPMPVTLDYGRSAQGLRRKGDQTIQSNAALWSLTAPEVYVVSDNYYNEDTAKREIILMVSTPRGATHWAVQIAAPAAITQLRVWNNTVNLKEPPAKFASNGFGGFTKFHVECVPCPADGLRVALVLDGTRGNLSVAMSETSWGLPYKDSSTAFPPFPWDDRPVPQQMQGIWWGMADPTIIFASSVVTSKVNSSGFEVVTSDTTTTTTTTGRGSSTRTGSVTATRSGSTVTGTFASRTNSYSGTGTPAATSGTFPVQVVSQTSRTTSRTASATSATRSTTRARRRRGFLMGWF